MKYTQKSESVRTVLEFYPTVVLVNGAAARLDWVAPNHLEITTLPSIITLQVNKFGNVLISVRQTKKL
jgi:hypothetical protein